MTPALGSVIAWARARVSVTAVLLALTPLLAPPAAAFEIFGWNPFGSDEDAVADGQSLGVDATLEVFGDEDLEDRLRGIANLTRSGAPPVADRIALLARARGDRDRLIAALYETGQYGAIVSISIDGRPLASVSFDDAMPEPVPVRIEISPGPVFSIGRVSIVGAPPQLGPLAEDAVIETGAVAEASAIRRSARMLRQAMLEEGYPFAQARASEVIADHATRTVDVTFALTPGERARLGPLTITGTERVDPDFVRARAAVPEGAVYSPRDPSDAEERLRDLDVFGSLGITLAESVDAQGRVPLTLIVRERKPHVLGASAAWSSLDGGSISGYWVHRNLFGGAERLRIEADVARLGASGIPDGLDYRLAARYLKPSRADPFASYGADIAFAVDHPDAFEREAIDTDIHYIKEMSPSLTAQVGLGASVSRIEDAFGETERLVLSLPGSLSYDNRESTLDPKDGAVARVEARPSYDFESAQPALRLYGSYATYWALSEEASTLLAARIAGGTIIGASLDEIAADQRFYAGGGGSVRGYAYQAIGPQVGDKPLGGLSLVEGSLELRQRIDEVWGAVAFLDAGHVSRRSVPDFDADPRAALGLGVRYQTGVGPLRLDIALPLNKREGDDSFGFYIGIGQAF